MEPLKGRTFRPGSLEAQASELLRGTAPYAVPSGLRRRVRERLLEGSRRRPLFRLVRPLLVPAGVLFALGAFAAAGEAPSRFFSPTTPVPGPASAQDRTAPHRTPAAPASSSTATTATSGNASSPPTAKPAPTSMISAGPFELGPRDVAELPALPKAAPSVLKPRTSTPTDPALDRNAPSEAALVYGAAKALRNSHDAARAAELLHEHARRYPGGALAEEALALRIEVALARGEAGARQLAKQYLARYPRGHFKAKAERALAP